ncbi:anti-sigma factor family protein [Burkholderia lata]
MDDILLMAYVDGELASHEREEVDRAIGTSADIAGRVALFEASVLPYRYAFQRQEWPPLPQRLVGKVAEIAQAYAGPLARSAVGGVRRGDALASQPDARTPSSVPVRSRVRMMVPWLAVAFVAGAFQVGSMDVVTWRRAGVSYALIAAPGDTDLGAIGKRIADFARSSQGETHPPLMDRSL